MAEAWAMPWLEQEARAFLPERCATSKANAGGGGQRKRETFTSDDIILPPLHELDVLWLKGGESR